MVWIHLAQDSYTLAYCEHGSELLDCVTSGTFWTS